MFILSDSPPDRDLEWTEAGLAEHGVYQPPLLFDNREKDFALTKAQRCPFRRNKETATKAHQTIHAIVQSIEAFHMNKAVAKLRELSNAIEEFKPESDDDAPFYREAIEYLVRIKPMAPHLTEELWSELGHKTLLVQTPWPDINPEFLIADTATIAIQINGKLKQQSSFRWTPYKKMQKAALEDDTIARSFGWKNHPQSDRYSQPYCQCRRRIIEL